MLGQRLGRLSMSGLDVRIAPTDIVAGRIAERYRTPARRAYLYLFRLKPDASLEGLVPVADSVLEAWMDVGDGLLPSPIDRVLTECRRAADIKPHTQTPTRLTAHERKQMMARAIMFIATQPEPSSVLINLASRALGFSPKGDRTALEEWRRSAEGRWYSTRREREEAEDAIRGD